MSSIETLTMQEIRERFTLRLSPEERADWEVAVDREKRLVTESREREAQIVRELDNLIAAARDFKGKLLSPLTVRRLVEHLYGAEAFENASPYRPQPKGRVERVNRQIAKGVIA